QTYCQIQNKEHFISMLPAALRVEMQNEYLDDLDEDSYSCLHIDEDSELAVCDNCAHQEEPCDNCVKSAGLLVNKSDSDSAFPARSNINSKRLALITLDGEITFDSYNDSAFSEESSITPNKVADLIKQVKSSNYAGVIIRVNSPGGSALASELILQQIIELQKTHTVYVSMGDVAASGGYYISSSASKIFADANTITGSIGVVAMIPNVRALSEKIGINPVTISHDDNSELFSLTSPLSAKSTTLLRNSMTSTYGEFLSRVSTGRKIEINLLHKQLAQGRVWSGIQAKENKLIDEIGTLYDTADSLAKALNIDDYSLVNIKTFPNVFNKLFSFNSITSLIKEQTPQSLQPAYKLYNKIKSYDSKPLLLFTHDLKL
ncbi:MAG: signal peptide peptidase SppA, partial [Lentisphaeria bacterium]